MGRARGCPGGVFPGEGPRPSTWPSQALQSLRSRLWTLSAACWRVQAPTELRVYLGVLSEAGGPQPWMQVSLSGDAGFPSSY